MKNILTTVVLFSVMICSTAAQTGENPISQAISNLYRPGVPVEATTITVTLNVKWVDGYEVSTTSTLAALSSDDYTTASEISSFHSDMVRLATQTGISQEDAYTAIVQQYQNTTLEVAVSRLNRFITVLNTRWRSIEKPAVDGGG